MPKILMLGGRLAIPKASGCSVSVVVCVYCNLNHCKWFPLGGALRTQQPVRVCSLYLNLIILFMKKCVYLA